MRRTEKILTALLLATIGLGASIGCSERHGAAANSGDDAATPPPKAGASAPDASTPADASAANPSDDPGNPGLMYGTLASAALKVSDAMVGHVAFTAIAPNATDRAHLFAKPDPAERNGVTEYYLSLVFARSGWAPGTYDSAVAGRVSFALTNGKRYEADGDEVEVELEVERAIETEGDELLLHATLTLTIPAATAGEAPLVLQATMH